MEELLIKCECNCSAISFDHDPDDKTTCVTFYQAYRIPFWRKLWWLITGRTLHELVMKPEDLLRLKEYINNKT